MPIWLRAGSAQDWRLIVRRSLILLALILAYLQCYFLDVQLQVVSLPSIMVPLYG